ncbi:sulfur carrier protein ThiS [Paenactinomyces guangxiensis]|uniref:Sulfur carrier protein ThiS n=1 Tax=Paenactinomyces guangxiensis TaxID=1490290 RepID=A0A7W2A7V8_9BACL|nr:sulfur carrier protein ThiS [Paenactinomyces guangxiensis]MBH8589947.1 sulfur carrier protein ThiS [Paenactinomyces guangxiensis]
MQLNGKEYLVAEGVVTIAHLLDHLRLGQRVLVVEHNRKVLQKEDHPQSVLGEGDVVEIVHFVGGG